MIVDLLEMLDRRAPGFGNSPDALDRALRELLEVWPLQMILDTYISNPELTLEAAKRSYRHPNGFDRIELVKSPSELYSVRLHSWRDKVDGKIENIHSHPWSFSSKIILGRLHFEQFVESSTGLEMFVSLYPRPSGETYGFRPGGSTTLQSVLNGQFCAGTHYSAHSSYIHRAWAEPGCQTLTLMLHGPGVDYPSKIYTPEPLETNEARFRDGFSPSALTEVLERVRSMLE